MGERAELRQAGAPTGWEVETARDGDRTWFTVLRDGWVIAEAYDGSAGWRCARRSSESLPGFVLEALPAGAARAMVGW